MALLLWHVLEGVDILLLLLLLSCRRFQPVYVLEPTEGQTLEILKGLSERYERHHRWARGGRGGGKWPATDP